MQLSAKIVAIHRALEAASLPHAFGGALALAFCIREARATKDIDLNVFVGVGRTEEVLAALPSPVEASAANLRQLERDAQSRLWWDETPVDLFLSNHPFHGSAEVRRNHVDFAGVERLPVLACADLAVFKAFFARPKDRIDVANMIEVGTVDVDDLEASVRGLMGDERADFFEQVRGIVAELG